MSKPTTPNDIAGKSASRAASTAQTRKYFVYCLGDNSWMVEGGNFNRDRAKAFGVDRETAEAMAVVANVAVPCYHEGQFRLFAQTNNYLRMRVAEITTGGNMESRLHQEEYLEAFFNAEVLGNSTNIVKWAEFVQALETAKPLHDIILTYVLANREGVTFDEIFEQCETQFRFARFEDGDVEQILNELLAERSIKIARVEWEEGIVFQKGDDPAHDPRPDCDCFACELAQAVADGRKAINGDSNDAEHDALFSLVTMLEQNTKGGVS